MPISLLPTRIQDRCDARGSLTFVGCLPLGLLRQKRVQISLPIPISPVRQDEQRIVSSHGKRDSGVAPEISKKLVVLRDILDE